MKHTVRYSERKYKRTINKNSAFIMIGNNIDGMVDFSFREFENYHHLSNELTGILSNLKCCGEWDINLYQITKPYKLRKRYGYYEYPNKGKLIFSHSYMDWPVKAIEFKENEIIIIGTELDITENWDNTEEDFQKYDLSIEILKIRIE